MSLKEAYPYYLGNKAVFANRDLEVTDKYTGKVATVVAQADPGAIDKGIQLAVDSQEAMRDFPPYKRQEVLNHCVARDFGEDWRLRALEGQRRVVPAASGGILGTDPEVPQAHVAEAPLVHVVVAELEQQQV